MHVYLRISQAQPSILGDILFRFNRLSQEKAMTKQSSNWAFWRQACAFSYEIPNILCHLVDAIDQKKSG